MFGIAPAGSANAGVTKCPCSSNGCSQSSAGEEMGLGFDHPGNGRPPSGLPAQGSVALAGNVTVSFDPAVLHTVTSPRTITFNEKGDIQVV